MFRRRSTFCDAVQFDDPEHPCRGVRLDVESKQFVVTTMQGHDVPVSVGEWIVAEADGEHFYPIDDVEFHRIYEPV